MNMDLNLDRSEIQTSIDFPVNLITTKLRHLQIFSSPSKHWK